MKKTAPKKMTLTRETLGTLSDKEMKEILGGALPTTTNSVNACCV
ncbi:MAG: class I lanthipeptide [Thermoanaerobaculia bacterium]